MLIFPVFSYLRFGVDGASAKIKSGGPAGDEEKQSTQWSGHIPWSLKAFDPVIDQTTDRHIKLGKGVMDFLKNFG